MGEYAGKFSVLKRSTLEEFLKQKEGTPAPPPLPADSCRTGPAARLTVACIVLHHSPPCLKFSPLTIAFNLVSLTLLALIPPMITLAVSAILFVFFLLFVFFTAKLSGSRRLFKAHFYFFSVIWSLFTSIYLLASLLWSLIAFPILSSGFFFALVFSRVLPAPDSIFHVRDLPLLQALSRHWRAPFNPFFRASVPCAVFAFPYTHRISLYRVSRGICRAGKLTYLTSLFPPISFTPP